MEHQSKSVYLLSYRRRSTQATLSEMKECRLPAELEKSVLACNDAFKTEVQSLLTDNVSFSSCL